MDLTSMIASELDEFAAWAHAVEGTDYVEIIDRPDLDPHDVAQDDARHGMNLEEETAV